MLKKWICFALSAVMVVSLAACGKETDTKPSYLAGDADVTFLDQAYAGRAVYYGEMHDHASTGGTSDGKRDLSFWKLAMASLDMDFATIVDHQQASHMELEEWDNAVFVGGSEALAMPAGLLDATVYQMHFNMIFTKAEDLINTIKEYDALYPGTGFCAQDYPADYTGPEAEKMAGGWHFDYLYAERTPTKAQMAKLIEIIKKNNGMFVHVHPRSDGCINSTNPEDFWFADETGLEVFYGYRGYAPAQKNTQDNYELWLNMLAVGKRVWATAGSDKHDMPNTDALTTVYSEEKHADAYLRHFKVGDFVCGPVGIRMAIGDATMGGETAFAGNRVVFSVGDFHKSAYNPTHTYRVELHDDRRVVFSQELTDPTQITYFAVDAAEDAAFYRVEIHDVTTDMLHALGNPIWNTNR